MTPSYKVNLSSSNFYELVAFQHELGFRFEKSEYDGCPYDGYQFKAYRASFLCGRKTAYRLGFSRNEIREAGLFWGPSFRARPGLTDRLFGGEGGMRARLTLNPESQTYRDRCAAARLRVFGPSADSCAEVR